MLTNLSQLRSSVLLTALSFASVLGFAQLPCDAVVSVTLRGTADRVLTLSAGEVDAGGTASVSSSATGAIVNGARVDQADFNSSIDFGDLSQGNGQPLVATVGLRVRSNCPFNLLIARENFSATNLQYHGHSVSGSSDGGSFINVLAGPKVSATGVDANASACKLSSVLSGTGLPLSQVTSGLPGIGSTLVASGTRVSLRGAKSSPSNAVDIPLSFSVPTGTSIGPITGGSGSFSTTVELAVVAM